MPRNGDSVCGAIVRRRKKLERMSDLKRRRMANVMAAAMDDRAAWLLADLTDAELRRVAELMFSHADGCVAQVEAERVSRRMEGRAGGGKDKAVAP